MVLLPSFLVVFTFPLGTFIPSKQLIASLLNNLGPSFEKSVQLAHIRLILTWAGTSG
jgi:hypothetical protein